MKKILVSLVFLVSFSNAAQVMIDYTDYSIDERLRTLEMFTEQKQVFNYLCEQCIMPPERIITEVYIESVNLGIPKTKALEDILGIFHLDVTAEVGYQTIEQLSLDFEREWDKVSKDKSKKK